MLICRCFLGLRGNEIQNDLWDYDPHDEDEEEQEYNTHDEYVQLQPNDAYRGGYWYYGNSFGRYLHIIALKSHEVDKGVRLDYLIVNDGSCEQCLKNTIADVYTKCLHFRTALS